MSYGRYPNSSYWLLDVYWGAQKSKPLPGIIKSYQNVIIYAENVKKSITGT